MISEGRLGSFVAAPGLFLPFGDKMHPRARRGRCSRFQVFSERSISDEPAGSVPLGD